MILVEKPCVKGDIPTGTLRKRDKTRGSVRVRLGAFDRVAQGALFFHHGPAAQRVATIFCGNRDRHQKKHEGQGEAAHCRLPI